jgi:hypothetical protein
MALPILKIAKVLARLTVLAPVATEGVDKIRALLETVQGQAAATGQLERLREAVALQSAINDEVAEQLRALNSLIDSLRRRLTLCLFAAGAAVLAAGASFVIAVLR